MEEAGFICPKLNYALRNPMKIADHAQTLIQDGARNFLDSVLRCPIKTSLVPENIVEGQLVRSDEIHSCSKDALCSSQQKIPFGKHALFFIDDTTISDECIKAAFSGRSIPIIFMGKEDTNELKNWLCDPENRKCDMCIIGTEHQCNGIETDVVVHIYVADCPVCQISNADPVIVSRAKAMLIISMYQRNECRCCGWKRSNQNVEDGLYHPLESSGIQETNAATDTQELNQTPTCLTLSRPQKDKLTIWQQFRHMDRKYQALSVTIILLILASVITAISLSLATLPSKGNAQNRF